jgi:hypothetical protein
MSLSFEGPRARQANGGEARRQSPDRARSILILQPNKSAEFLQERIAGRCPPSGRQPICSNFHQIGDAGVGLCPNSGQIPPAGGQSAGMLKEEAAI